MSSLIHKHYTWTCWWTDWGKIYMHHTIYSSRVHTKKSLYLY